ncbi:MAG: hypothetical protein WCO65_03595 [bacterium]
MKKTNAILGLIKNYDWVDLEPFVSSLKHSGYKDKTIFFYNNIDDDTLKKLASHNIELIKFEEKFPYLEEKYSKDMGILTKDLVLEKNFFSFRYVVYYLFLRNSTQNYENIMLTDIRDVVFQKDPFDFEINGKLCCFLESEEWPIKKSEHNAVGILKSYSKEEMDKIGDNLIACAGTIIGSGQEMKNYVTLLLEEFIKLKNKFADDQFIFNYLLWNGMLPNSATFKNHYSPVLTLGYEKKVYTNKAGQITDRFGKVVNTIHQYDRHGFTQLKYGNYVFKWRSTIKFIKITIYKKFVLGYIRKISPAMFFKIRAFIKRKKK